MTEITADDLERLAAKLDALELDEAERAVLDGILERAEAYEPDVEGFGFGTSSLTYSGLQSGATLSGTSLQLGGSLGFVTRPTLGYGDPNDPIGDPGGPIKKPPPP